MNFTLNTGHSIPSLGLGTWRAKGQEVYDAVKHALAVGYRHLDTAVLYENEAEVGRGLSDSGVPRDQVFLTTKILNSVKTREQAFRQITESCATLGVDYLDLVLIHWPWTYERNAAVYAGMEDAVDAGKVRSLGVSNFNIHHLDHLLGSARIAPAVNQMECHVFLQNTRLKDYLDEKGMLLEAYAPLKSWKVDEVLSNETLKEIGANHGKAPTQVSLRWLLQRGIVALPKSVTPSRIEENFEVFDFELSAAEMQAIRKLNKGERLFPEPDNVDFGFVTL